MTMKREHTLMWLVLALTMALSVATSHPQAAWAKQPNAASSQTAEAESAADDASSDDDPDGSDDASGDEKSGDDDTGDGNGDDTGDDTGEQEEPSSPVTIVYEATDETIEGYMDPQTIEAGGSATLAPNGYSRPGYHSVGWVDQQGTFYADGATILASDISVDLLILYPVWEANTYTILLDPAGGSVESGSIQCAFGESVPLPTPSWLGHTFTGWVTDLPSLSSDTRLFDIGTMPPAANGSVFNFTATWTATPITASFDPLYPEGAGEAPASASLEYGVSEVALPELACEGYVFLGWEVRGGLVLAPGAYNSAEVLGDDSSNIVLYGVWRRNSYTLSYDLAGGALVIGDATVSKPPADQLEVGTHIVIPSPVRDGYLFVGWQDDDGNVHAPGSVLDSLASEDGEHVTLTALWEKDPAAQEEPAKPEAPKDETEENDTSAVDASDDTQQTADQTEEPLEDEQDSDKSPADTEEFEREKQRKEDSADVALVGGVAIPLSTVPQGPFEDVLPPVEEVRDDSRVEVILVLLGAIATAIVVIVALRMFDARRGGARRRSS